MSFIGNLAAKGLKSLYSRMAGNSGHRERILDIQIAFLNDNNKHSGIFRDVGTENYSSNLDDYCNFYEHPLIIKEKLFAYLYVLWFSKKNNHGYVNILKEFESDIINQGHNYSSTFKVENSYENQQLLIKIFNKTKDLFEKNYRVYENLLENFPLLDKILSIYETDESEEIKTKATLRMFFHIATFIATSEQTIAYHNELKSSMGASMEDLLIKVEKIIERNIHTQKDEPELLELAKHIRYDIYNNLNFKNRDIKMLQMALILNKKMKISEAELLAQDYMTRIYPNNLYFNDYLISKEILSHLDKNSFNLYKPMLVF